MAEYLIRITDLELECNTDDCLRILIEDRVEEAREMQRILSENIDPANEGEGQ